MRSLRLGTCLSAALVLCMLWASGAFATPIGPPPLSCSNSTCQGSIYEITYSGSPISTTATTETFRITYTINTAGYNGAGTNLNAVALKVSSSFVSASLFSAPGGTANWLQMHGGLADAGCTGTGSGFDCVAFKLMLSLAPSVPNGTYTWVFDIEVPTGGLFTGANQASVKARYGNSTTAKIGALVSEGITLEVPEPGLTLLLAGSLLGLARRARQP